MRIDLLSYVAIILLLCKFQLSCFGQILNQPEIACPQFFEYVCTSGNCFGKITIPNISYGRTIVQADFSQLAPVISGYYGSIYNMDESDTVLNQISRHEPIAFRADFPLRNELPKLTKIVVNGLVICSANAYPAPSTRITLKIENFSEIVYSTLSGNFNYNQQQQGVVQSEDANYFVVKNKILPPAYPLQSDLTHVPHKGTQPGPFTQIDDLQFFKSFPNDQMSSRRMESNNVWTPTKEFIPVSDVQTDSILPTHVLSNEFEIQQNSATICGVENDKPAIVPFITGGIILHPGQFPWLTAIYHRTVLGTSFICGGSLISTQTVLTAAHCFALTQLKSDNVAVALGRHDISKSNEMGGVARDIKNLIIHTEYDPDNFPDADIALLIMAESVRFTDVIKPICLWTNDIEDDVINETGFVAGWGGDAFGNTLSPVPKMAPATIVSEAVCRKSSDLLKKLVTSRTLCAGEQNGVGPCMGDSGGGLMLQRHGRWLLRGVVSAGTTERSRCNLRKFAVYCDVAKYSSWVISKML